MTTSTLQEPGLPDSSQWQKPQKQKPSKVTTTVRLDSDLKRRAEEYARANHMDFTTFLSFSIRNTMQYGGKIEPYYEVSDEYANYLDEIEARYERGEDKWYGPFEGDEAITFLKTLY